MPQLVEENQQPKKENELNNGQNTRHI